MTKILIGGWDKEEFSLLRDLSDNLGIEKIISLNSNDLDKYIKVIIEDKNHENNGDILDEKFIIFDGLDKSEISEFIEGYKKLGLPSPIFAMVTEHSINWKLKDLLEHLVEEREEFKKMSK
jgi:hypothetical protein